jgi:uncharacterized protein with ParB-like and HNH nuclease domain
LEVKQKTWDNIVKRRKTCASEIGVHKIHRSLKINKKQMVRRRRGVLNINKYGKSVTTNLYGDYMDDLYALSMPRGTVKRMKKHE